MEECPVKIHKVTEDVGDNKEKKTSSGVCPITGAKSAPTETQSTDTDFVHEFEENPSYQEYKKIKKVMSMITRFYQAGSDGKKANYDASTAEIEKLELDLSMVEAQINALNAKSSFNAHPKRKDYLRNLNEERENLIKQREKMRVQQKEFYDLYEWSKGIVKVCEWLETNLDHYCVHKLKDLPEKIKLSIKPAQELSGEQALEFAKGLDEVVYNLKESQDFFAASLDGRLNKYHNIEKEIIEAQLEVIRKFPEDNPRRTYVENELLQDLEYVENNMKESPEVVKRREKMLTSHQEFFQVLLYNKEKLEAMGIKVNERTYDPKYDHYN